MVSAIRLGVAIEGRGRLQTLLWVCMLVHILVQSLRVTVHLYFYILSFAEMTIELCSVFYYVLLKKCLPTQEKNLYEYIFKCITYREVYEYVQNIGWFTI